jgi:hypothetical protein
MQALAAAPDSAFSEGLLYDYYEIVREIYTADVPDWCIGGARQDRRHGLRICDGAPATTPLAPSRAAC